MTDNLNKGQKAFERDFPNLPIVPSVDHEAIARLEAFAADARREMGEARWQELCAEWEAV